MKNDSSTSLFKSLLSGKAMTAYTGTRAGLHSMQLHWARASGGPAPWCLERLFNFRQILLELKNSVETAYKSHCISLLANNYLV